MNAACEVEKYDIGMDEVGKAQEGYEMALRKIRASRAHEQHRKRLAVLKE